MAIAATLALDVSEDILVARLLERGKDSGRVDDQDEAKIATRMRIYHDETLPVATYYAQKNKLFRVHGVGTVDAIFDRIVAIMEKLPFIPALK